MIIIITHHVHGANYCGQAITVVRAPINHAFPTKCGTIHTGPCSEYSHPFTVFKSPPPSSRVFQLKIGTDINLAVRLLSVWFFWLFSCIARGNALAWNGFASIVRSLNFPVVWIQFGKLLKCYYITSPVLLVAQEVNLDAFDLHVGVAWN